MAGAALMSMSVVQPVAAADLDLSASYAHRRCHGGEDAGEGLNVGVPG